MTIIWNDYEIQVLRLLKEHLDNNLQALQSFNSIPNSNSYKKLVCSQIFSFKQAMISLMQSLKHFVFVNNQLAQLLLPYLISCLQLILKDHSDGFCQLLQIQYNQIFADKNDHVDHCHRLLLNHLNNTRQLLYLQKKQIWQFRNFQIHQFLGMFYLKSRQANVYLDNYIYKFDCLLQSQFNQTLEMLHMQQIIDSDEEFAFSKLLTDVEIH